MVTSITFKATELVRLLANAILFAAPEKDMLPAISVVRFEWFDGQLFAVATNRYVLSWEEASPVNSTPPGEGFSIDIANAKKVIAMLKAFKWGAPEATMTFDSDTNRIEVTCLDDTMRFAASESQFLKWRRIADGYAPGAVKEIRFTGKYLALLAKVDGGNAPIQFELAEGSQPVRATIGEHFRAMVCTVRDAA